MNQNFNDQRDPWTRLTSAARDAGEDRDASAPYGFATRVVALAFAQERRVSSLFERFAMRAVGVASLLALFSVALNYPTLSSTVTATTAMATQVDEVDLVAVDDAVSIVLDFRGLMDVPWKVILAFLGVFIAGAVFGGVFTLGVSARRIVNSPRHPASADIPVAQFPAVVQPKAQVAGPQAPKSAPAPGRTNPITPVLMNQFTRKLSGLTPPQKDSLRTILGRAGEDFQRLRQDNLADVTRVTERMYADVSGVLTMEQRSELEMMRKQLEERFKEDRRKRAEAADANRAANPPPGTATKTRPASPEAAQGNAK